MSHLFVFRTYPDIDHLAPMAWKLLEEGDEVHAVVSPGYDPSGDHRIDLLRGYARFRLREVVTPGGGRRARLAGMVRNTLPYALLHLLRGRISVVAVEWGYGLDAGYDRLLSPAGVRAVLRSFAGSFRRGLRLDPHQTRVNYLVAARLLGRATVCLPHGLSIKLDTVTTDEVRDMLANGTLDWRDRNRFSQYVLNTEHHRQFHLEHAGGDPEVMQTWGSLRWSPSWFELNRRLAPPYAWPGADDRVKVVFMLPKWRNRVHADAVVDLVKRLQGLPFVSLAIKGHARPQTGDADPLHADADVDWDRIADVSRVDSVSLIAAADAVLDVGSSIGLEVVMQGKLLINPTYIHELTTLFDDIPGACTVADDADAVVRVLEQAAAGAAPQPTGVAIEELLRRAVYGDREPFDIPQLYYDRFQALATQRRR